jgi:CubicO group peptidase (beta-lactamase class C family)
MFVAGNPSGNHCRPDKQQANHLENNMKKSSSILLLVISFLTFSSAIAQTPFQNDTARKIAELAQANSDLGMFSGTVLVAKNGNVIYAEAFGEANKDHHLLNKLETRFNTGSIGKTITAVAVMQLVQDGKLRLSDTLGKFYPECPFAKKDTITIYHLLTHTSGLGDYLEHGDYLSKKATYRSIGDALPLIFDQKPSFPPGEKFKYSNSGFYLLGGIVQKASGMPYREYIRERIFKPSGMTESDLAPEDEVLENRAIGYSQNFDGTFTANILTVPTPCPAGGLRCSAKDLLKFDRALREEVLLSESVKQVMFTPSAISPTKACGWEAKDFFGERFNGHSGGADGVEAYFYRFLDSGYTVIVLSNYHNGAEELTSNIMNLLFDKPYSIPTKVDANFRLGYRLQKENKLREAAVVLERNLANNPPHLFSLFFSGNIRIRGKFEIEKAVDYLDRFLRLAGKNDFPPATLVWEQKATAFELLGRQAEAIAALEKSLKLDPQNPSALERLKKIKGDK